MLVEDEHLLREIPGASEIMAWVGGGDGAHTSRALVVIVYSSQLERK